MLMPDNNGKCRLESIRPDQSFAAYSDSIKGQWIGPYLMGSSIQDSWEWRIRQPSFSFFQIMVNTCLDWVLSPLFNFIIALSRLVRRAVSDARGITCKLCTSTCCRSLM
jgi:hypothetical protein